MARARRKETVKLLGVARRRRAALLMSTALQASVVIVLAVPGFTSPVAAQPAPNARPTGGAVIAGAASISQAPAQTTISQSTNRAALSWQSYNVGSQQSVVYHQPSSSSVTLNRVDGPNPSQIAGRIEANGKIVLMNQAGVTFYQGAQVNTNGLMVTAASMSDGAMKGFVNTGAMNFDRAPNPNAQVVNRGNITVRQAGLAALVAPSVANSGTITARLGHVVLAGANRTTLDMYGDGLVSIDVSGEVTKVPVGPDGKPVTALVTNTGVIQADGGTVQLTAREADGVVTRLVDAGGQISANSVAGHTGVVALNGVGGDIVVQGQISAAGRVAGTHGGDVTVNSTGNVTVASTARIDASGRAGGGTVAIGTTLARAKGGPGVTPTLTAAGVQVQKGAVVRADAIVKGNGGRVTVLSTGVSTMDGDISARGGAKSGNGGFAEFSGASIGSQTGSIDVSAPAGMAGIILLDPNDLIIQSGSAGTGNVDNYFTAITPGTVATGDPPNSATLSTGVLDGFKSRAVLLQAGQTIEVQNGFSLGGTVALTLEAGNLIKVDSSQSVQAGGDIIFATGGAGPGTPPAAGGAPNIAISGTVTSTAGSISMLSGKGGTISLGNGGTIIAGNSNTVSLQGDSLSVSGGTISAGTIEIAPATTNNAISFSSNQPGTLFVDPTALSNFVTASGTLRLGAITAGGSSTITAGSISLDNTFDASAVAPTLELQATGSVIQTSGSLLANMLSASSAGGSVSLINTSNNVNTLTGVSAANDTTLVGQFHTLTGTFTAANLFIENASTGGTMAMSGATLNATAPDPRISIVTDAIANLPGSIAAGGGTLEIAPFSTVTPVVIGTDPGADALVMDPTALASVLGSPLNTLRVGGYTDVLNGSTIATTASSINLANTADLTTVASVLDLRSSGAATQSTATVLTVDTLTGTVASLDFTTGNPNGVRTLDAFAATSGDLKLNDAVPLAVKSLTVSGNAYLASSGSMTLNSFINAGIASGTIGLRTDSLVFAGGFTSLSAATVEIAPNSTTLPIPVALGVASSAGTLGVADLTGINAGTVRIGQVNGETTAASINVAAGFGNTLTALDLHSLGGITGSALAASTLTGSAAAGVSLTASNVVTLGGLISDGGDIFLDDSGLTAGGTLTVTGPVTAPAGNAVTLTGAPTLAVDGSVIASNVSLIANTVSEDTGGFISGTSGVTIAGGTLNLAGTINDGGTTPGTGTIDLIGTTGAISQTGTLVGNTLIGSAPGLVTLLGASANANQIANLGDFLNTSGFQLNDGHSLNANGTVTAPGGSITMNDGQLLTDNGAVSGNAVTLTAGTISVPGLVTDNNGSGVVLNGTVAGIAETGTLDAMILSGSAVGAVSLTGATTTTNQVGTLASFTAGSFALNDGLPLSVTGLVKATSGDLYLQSSSIAVAGSGTLLALGHRVSLQTGGATNSGTIVAGTFEFAPISGPLSIGIGGALTSLTGISANIAVLGSVTLPAGGSSVAAALNTVGSFDGNALPVALITTGTVGEAASAPIVNVTTLTGSATAIGLAQANAIGTLGSLTASGGDVDLNNTGTTAVLKLAGPVSGKNVTITADQLAQNGSVTANTGSVVLATTTGTLSESGSVSAVTGAILTAQSDLTVANTGTVSVSGASGMAVLGATTGDLIQNGAVLANAISETAVAGNLTHAGTSSAQTGGVKLFASDNISQTGGIITAANGTVSVTGGTSVTQSGGAIQTTGAGTNAILLTSDGSGTSGITQLAAGVIQASDIGGSIAVTSKGTIALGGTLRAVDNANGIIRAAALGTTFTETGTLTAGALASLTAQTDLTNSGTITVTNGPAVMIATTGTLSQSGLVSASGGGTLSAGTNLNNSGSVTISAGPAILTASGDLTQNGLVQATSVAETAGGSLNHAGTSNATATTAILTANAGTITQAGIVTAVSGGTLVAATDLNNTGSMLVSAGPASLTATAGNLTQNGLVQATSVAETAGGSLNHAGTSNATVTTAILTANAGTITQAGIVTALSGGTLMAATDLNNTGSMLVSAGPASLTATAGNLTQNGLVQATSVIETAGGALTHGGITDATASTVVLQANGGTLAQSGTVAGVTLASLTASTDLINSGLVSVTGTNGVATLAGNTITLTPTGTVQATGTTGSISETAASALVHDGTTSGGSGGVTLAAKGASVTQTGGIITAMNGSVSVTAAGGITQNSGTIQTTGTAPTVILLTENGPGAGITQAPAGTIHASDSGGSVTLISLGTIGLAGLVSAVDSTAGTVSATASGGTLNNSGTVTAGALASLTAQTDMTQAGLVDGKTVTETAGLNLTHSGVTNAGNATLTASGGTLLQNGTVAAVGAASLAAQSTLTNSGLVSVSGDSGLAKLTSGASDIGNSGTIQATGTAGAVDLNAAGSINQTAGLIAAAGSSGTATLIANGSIGQSGGTILSGGSGVIAASGSSTANLSLIAQNGSIEQDTGAVIQTTNKSGVIGLQASGDIDFAGSILAPGLLQAGLIPVATTLAGISMTSANGSIVENSSNGVLQAELLIGSASGSVTLNGITGNLIANLGRFSAGGSFSLVDAQDLSVIAPVIASGGSLTITGTHLAGSSPSNLTNEALIQARMDVALTTDDNVTNSGTIQSINNNVSVLANGGTIGNNGLLDAANNALLMAHTDLLNAGTIQTHTGSATLDALSGTVSNTGLVNARYDAVLSAGANIDNADGATLSAGHFASLTATGAIDDSGLITAAGAGVGGTPSLQLIATGGTIDEAGTGVIRATNGTGAIGLSTGTTARDITLAGQVLATGNAGQISIDSAGAVTQNGGMISAGQAGNSGAPSVLITASGGTIRQNAGTILVSSLNGLIALNAASDIDTADSIGATGSAGVVVLTASGSINQTAGTIQSNGAGTIAVSGVIGAPNLIFAANGGTIAQSAGAVIYAPNAAGVIQLRASSSIIQSGLVSATGSDAGIELLSSGGSILQTPPSGILTANMLIGSAAQGVQLTGTSANGNLVANLGSFTASGGNFTLIDGENLLVAGPVIANAGSVAITATHFGGGQASSAINQSTIQGQTGVTLAADIGVTNSGSILAPTNGVSITATAGSLDNTGLISAAHDAVILAGTDIQNSGTILAIDNDLLLTANDGVLRTTGSISAGQLATLQALNGPMTLGGIMSAPTIVANGGANQITFDSGINIVTDGTLRPTGTLEVLPPNGFTTKGAYISGGSFRQLGYGAVSTLSGTGNVLRINVTKGPLTFSSSGLTAPDTWLILDGANGAISGAVKVKALDVLFSGNAGSANLTGTINGYSGAAAAGQANIEPNRNAKYHLNSCPIRSVSCVLLPTESIPTANPLDEIFIGSFFNSQDDSYLLLPIVSDQDY